MKVEFMTANGLWRNSGMHENNIEKNYYKFKVNRNFDYYRSDSNDMIYRIYVRKEKMVKDVIKDFIILIKANMIDSDILLCSTARFTKLSFDSTVFPIHEEVFKSTWNDLMEKVKYTKLSEL